MRPFSAGFAAAGCGGFGAGFAASVEGLEVRKSLGIVERGQGAEEPFVGFAKIAKDLLGHEQAP